jgi:hypothetical protein
VKLDEKKIDLKVDFPCNALCPEGFSFDGKFIYICMADFKILPQDKY